MAGTRRVSIAVAVAMVGGMVAAVIPALPAAAIVADPSSINQHFITGASSPFGVAVVSVDSDHVYWGNAGTDTIGRANLDGSSPDENFINARVNTSGNQEATNGVAVFGNHIYWSNQFTGTIGMATLNGDGPATALNKQLITGGNQTTRVVVTSDHIYWANNGNNTIGRADFDLSGNLIPASINQSFINTGAGPVGLAVDSNFIYWANQNANSIGRADLDGNAFVGQQLVHHHRCHDAGRRGGRLRSYLLGQLLGQHRQRGEPRRREQRSGVDLGRQQPAWRSGRLQLHLLGQQRRRLDRAGRARRRAGCTDDRDRDRWNRFGFGDVHAAGRTMAEARSCVSTRCARRRILA